ncbi:MAG: LAGLIDADG family homing endonuclease [Minisyncoccota bacterium]
MSETSNNRILFNRAGVQNKYILNVKKILNLTELELAQKLDVSQRTLRDWTKERLTMSQVALKKMSDWSQLQSPTHSVIDWKLHYQKAGKIGAKAKFERYGNVGGDEEYRKEKWKEWWEKTGQNKKPAPGFVTLQKIKLPRKSKLLAEFIGILLGDGYISNYYVSVVLSSEEVEYREYVKKVIHSLFGITPVIFRHKDKKAISIIVNRKLLVEFCQKVGFEKGNKVTHQVDIPQWIKENKPFARECIRGLVDTDGCFFTHSYKVNGKRYSYLKIAFTSASTPLSLSVAQILTDNGFVVRMSSVRLNSNGRDIRIDDEKYVTKYIEEIGSHNSKHLDKIKQWNTSKLR